MRKYLVLFILLGCFSLQAQTKTQNVVNDWTLLASNSAVASNEIDVSGMFSMTLYIQHALTTTATEQAIGAFIVESASTAAALDEDWSEMFRIPMVTGTPNSEAFTATEPIGETTIALSSTTGLYENDGTRWMFVLDNTIGSSEMVKVVSAVNNTSITILDGLTNEHTSADVMFDIAHSGAYYVDVYQKDRIRITVDNTLDAGGPAVHFRISRESADAN